MLCTPCLRKKSFTPTSSDIDNLLSKIEKILNDLKAQIESCNTFPHKMIEYWEDQIKKLKEKEKPKEGDVGGITGQTEKAQPTTPDKPATQDKKDADETLEILMKDGNVDQGAWDKKPDEEKRKIWDLLETAFRELRCLNQDSLQLGQCYFWKFAFLLALIVSVYLFLHANLVLHLVPYAIQQPRLTSERAAEIWEQARKIELQLAELKEKRRLAEKSEEEKAKSSETSKDVQKAKPIEKKPAAEAKKPTGDDKTVFDNRKQIIKLQKQVIEDIRCLKDLLDGRKCQPQEAKGAKDPQETKPTSLPFPFETSQLIGKVSAEAELDDPSIYATYQEFLKRLRADLESFSTAYFWTVPPWRWLELVFWAWMGCFVGLLFYMAGTLSQGIFKVEEVIMFWAEILIAPIVVLVVFFLFALSGITDFVPSEASVTVNIGVAFIFGFAIRRTVGLLDIIKKRFFPDPAPGSTSPGS